MENKLICLDTSVLIEYFRKTKKERSFFVSLVQKQAKFAVSVITKFEILSGSNENQKEFWGEIFQKMIVLPFDEKANEAALAIFQDLKGKSKLIDLPDLFIGATAKSNKLKLATLNKKHFSRIKGLELVTSTAT